jgi:hypothetical protein
MALVHLPPQEAPRLKMPGIRLMDTRSRVKYPHPPSMGNRLPAKR